MIQRRRPVSPFAIDEPSDPITCTDGLLSRALKALDIDPWHFAKEQGISYDEVLGVYKAGNRDVAIDHTEVWSKLNAYVTKRLGVLLGIREELQRKLANDMRKRQEGRDRITDR